MIGPLTWGLRRSWVAGRGSVRGMALVLVLALAVGGMPWAAQPPAEEDGFILSDQDSEVYYHYVAVAGESLGLDSGGRMVGNLHSNDKIDIKKDAVVDGDVSAVVEVKNKGQINGTVTEGVDPLELPAILSEADWRALADRIFEKDQDFENAVIDDIVFVAGKVKIKGSINGRGTLIASREIRIEDGKVKKSDPPVVLDDDTRLSFISLEGIRLGKERAFRGVLRAGRDISIESDVQLEGVLVAGRKLDIKKDSTVTFLDLDDEAPEITLVAPPDGSFVGTVTPQIVVEYTDDFSGLRLDSLSFLLDGVERVGEAAVSETGFAFTPGTALVEGLHTIEVAITDRSDNEGRETFSFIVDVTPPVLDLVAPTAAFTNDATPAIVVFFGDSGAGIDLGSLSIQMDGVELVAGCAVDLTGASCESSVLAEGSHQITVSIRDAAGNLSGTSFGFTVDLTPPEILATADPAANAAGWNAGDVTVTFDCQDALSGIVACPDPVVLAQDCLEQEVTGTVFDVAGNSASVSVTVRVDRLAPEIAGSLDPAANGANWNHSATTASFSATDACSGVAEVTDPVLLDTEGAGQEVQGTATDLAGHSATATVLANIDLTPPAISATAAPPANGAGWNNTEVTVTFDCQDALSGIASCPSPVTVSGDGADQVADGTVFDVAGNSATVSVSVSVDRTPPTIQATASPAANAAGWNNTDVTVSFACQDGLSGVASCPAAQVLSGEGAGLSASGTAFDVAGNSASASASVSIDRTPPTFDPAELRPRPCPELTLELQAPVRACFADALAGVVAGTVQLLVDGVDRTASAVVSGGCIQWDPPDAFVPGEHQGQIVASDGAGNSGSATWCFEVASPALDIAIDTPAVGLLTQANQVDVTGTVDALADTVEVGGVAATVTGGSFQALGVPLREGKNVLTAVARNSAGGVGTASVTVSRDTTAPTVRIETPRGGAVLTSLQVDVAGLVNDLVTGTTINADDCQVSINGVEAVVANRTFIASNLLLKRGVNTLVAEARDRAGNSSSHSIQVTVQDQAGQRIVLLAGNNQAGQIFQELLEPFIVALQDANGDTVPLRPVTFTVSRGDGTLKAFPQEGNTITVLTDELGYARMRFQLSGRSGAGNNRVLATAPGFLGEVEFCAGAGPGAAARVTTVSGSGQRGVVERRLPLPLVVLVTDQAGNPVGGVDVTFDIGDGGGNFAGSPFVVATTDLDGLAQALWTLGPDEGINNNTAQASFAGLTEAAATFTATARRIGRPVDTSLSGIVLDNQDEPVPGVTLHIRGTALSTTSDEAGLFSIAGAPVGNVVLEVDGGTTTRPGTWPHLEFELTTVSGRDNSVDRPIYLLPLAAGQIAGGSEDVVLSLENVPGSELTVYANSVTCPDGSSTCEVSVTQVRGERVPMEPPMGSSFMLAWTIQPAGARFNPPARLCIPNADQPPGQQVEMFSFDHDQGEFVAIGTATVTPDGSQVCSDPGFGVVKAGWHGCTPPPPPRDCVADCGPCKRCNRSTGSCEPVSNGSSCDDENDCTGPDMCMGGSCMGEPKEDGTACEDDGVACTFDQCKSGNCDHPTGTVEVTLDAPNGFDINDVPEMPEIMAMAKITGVDPDPTDQATFRWETKIEKQFCGVRDINEELDPVETGKDYTPTFPNTRGGMLNVKATLLRDGEDCAMGEKDEMIRGTNPPVGDIDGALGFAMAQRMACQESRKRQFSPSPGDPLLNCEPDGRIGVGILQVTTPNPTDNAFWNWRQDITEGLAILASKQNEAAGWAQRTRNRLGDQTIPLLTAQQVECEWVQRFNGGAYWRWNAQARQWEARPPNTYVSLVLSWSTAGACATVPVGSRPTCQ